MLTDGYMANEETFPTCGYYLYDTVGHISSSNLKANLKYSYFTLLSPIYTIGLLIYGVFAFVQFLTQGGFFGLLIWIISIIYHFFFTFLPFLLNLVV